MPIYEVQGPDGRIYEVEGPAGAKQAEIIRAVRQQIRQSREKEIQSLLYPEPGPAAPPETTVGGNVKEFFKGIAPGAVGLAETAGTGIAAALPEEAEKSVREGISGLAAAAKKPFEAAPGYEESVGRKLGQAVGSTLPFFALGPLGAAGRLAGAGVGAAAGAGEARMGAEADKATGDERALATALGIGPGLLDVVAPSLNIGKNIVTRAFAKGGVEGATEAAQNVAQNLIAAGVYNPDRPLFEGTAEEGAYGAGAGALASLLVDVVAGRRARGTTPPPPAEEKPGIAGLLENKGVFKPVVFPDGSVAMTPEDVKAYEDELFRRKYAPQEGGMPAPKFTGQVQGDLFPAETREALMTMAQMQGPPAPAAPTEPPAAPSTEPGPVQPDMIAEDEARQLREMDVAAQIGPRNEAEIQRVQAQAAERDAQAFSQAESDAQAAKTELLSAIEELDGRLKAKQDKTTEEERMGLLTDIIQTRPDVNLSYAFNKALQDAGFTDTEFTPRERALIERVTSFREAVPETPEMVPSAPTELGALEAAIREKKAREPEQLGFPGMGKPKGAAPVVPEAVEPEVEESASAGKQMEMFGPRGGVLAPTKGVPKNVATGTQPAAVGVSPEGGVGSQQGQSTAPPAAGGVGPSGVQRLVGGVQSTATGEATTEGKPAAIADLTPEEQALIPGYLETGFTVDEAIARIQKKREKTKAKEEKKVEKSKEGNKTEKSKEGNKTEKSTEERAKEEGKKLEDKVKSKKKAKAKLTAAEEAASNYFAAAKSAANALRYLAGDIYFASVTPSGAFSQEYKWGRPSVLVPNTGGVFAKNFYNSLDPAAKKVVDDMVSELRRRDQRVRAELNALDDLKMMQQEEQQSYELRAYAMLGGSLHPAAADALKDGNLKGALDILAEKMEGMMGKVAAKLAANLGNTKIEVSKSLKDSNGVEVAGYYDPKTDTIYLNADIGMTPHALLHETVHAVTSHVLTNKSHPVTKQLTELYDAVKDQLDTAYGATSLDEFVAEAFSNPEFQGKLTEITLQGGKVSGWAKFVNSVTNFLRSLVGLDSKPLTSAQTRADELISSILSPAPAFRDAMELRLAAANGTGGKILDRLGQFSSQRADTALERLLDDFSGWFDTAKDFAKDTLLGALPLHALVDVAETKLPMVKDFRRLLKQSEGKLLNRNNKLEASQRKVSEWASKNSDKMTAFNNVIYDSTLNQVDPLEPRSKYEGKTDESGNSKAKAWDDLQKDWKAIGPEGQEMFREMRNAYGALYDEIGRVLEERLKDGLGDAETAGKVKRDIWNRLFEKSGRLEPYFPLTRQGKYWLSYNAKDPRTGNEELFVELFESRRERARAQEALKAEGIKSEAFSQMPRNHYRTAPPTSFINSIVRTLDANKVNPEVKEEVMTLFVNLLPETSFAQSFRKRQNRLGFRRDALGAFQTKAYSISRQLNNIEFGAKYGKLKDEIREFQKKQGSEEVTALANELEKRIDFAISPDMPAWSKLAKSFGFNMTLGFNVSSALINASQIPLVVQPYLGGKYGEVKAAQAIGYATRRFFGSGLSRKAKTITGDEKDMPASFSLDNIDFSQKGLDPDIKELKALVEMGREYGAFNRSLAYDILDVEDRSILAKINAFSGYIFHQGERMNREVTMVAAYKLELDRLKADNKGKPLTEKQMQEAAELALNTVDMTNGGTTMAAAPRLAQGPIRSVIFMFKNYGVSMYYLLFKTANAALAGESEEVRRAAKKQLAGVFASSALLAGAQGLPMFGVLAMMYNLFLADDDEPKFDEAARQWMGDFYYNGPLQAAFGVEIASRMGLSDLIFRDGLVRDQQSVFLSAMEMMGGPVFGVASRMERGINLIAEGNTARGIEQMLPSAIGNGLKSIRFATEGANTLRGDPITDDLGAASVVGQAFGFAPAEYVKQLEENAMKKRIDKDVNDTRTKLLKKYYIAIRQGDTEGAQDILDDMAELGAKHPGMAITAKTLRNSMKQHMRTTAEMYHGITLTKKMRSELNELSFDSDLEDEE